MPFHLFCLLLCFVIASVSIVYSQQKFILLPSSSNDNYHNNHHTQQQQKQQQQSRIHGDNTHNQNEYNNNYNNHHRPFPRWDSNDGNSNNITIFSNPLLLFDFLNHTIYNKTISMIQYHDNYMFHEVFYTLNQEGLYYNNVLRNRNVKKFITNRIQPMEYMMIKSFQLLKQIHYNNSTTTNNNKHKNKWQRLRQVLFESNNNNGIPFFVYYGDYRECCYQNYNYYNHPMSSGNTTTTVTTTTTTTTTTTDSTTATMIKVSIPIFTVAASINCNYSFPIPTYKTIEHSKTNSSIWILMMEQWKSQYPYNQKIKKIIWRGSLSGHLNNYTSIRWRLSSYIYANSRKNTTISNMFDVGITKIPLNRYNETIKDRNDNHDTNYTSLLINNINRYTGGLKSSIQPMDEFQKFIGIIDIDGNSWSSRFGKLLCYNSVILKVDPHYVDYFYYPKNTNNTTNKIHTLLQPWKHYIPIKYDLSNLIEQTEFVLNPNNINITRTIISNANEWCKHRMIYESIMYDYLDIWESYIIQYLDENNNNNNNTSSSNNNNNNSDSNNNWMNVWEEIYQSYIVSNSTSSTNNHNNYAMTLVQYPQKRNTNNNNKKNNKKQNSS